jgi:hypothetical protein
LSVAPGCCGFYFVRLAFPFWVTVTTHGPIVSVADLLHMLLFTLAAYMTSPAPVPAVAEGISQPALDRTPHEHPEPVVTVTWPVPPETGKLAEAGDTL